MAAETGFQTDHLVVISEPDIFGQRLSRPQSKRAKGDEFLARSALLRRAIWWSMPNMALAAMKG